MRCRHCVIIRMSDVSHFKASYPNLYLCIHVYKVIIQWKGEKIGNIFFVTVRLLRHRTRPASDVFMSFCFLFSQFSELHATNTGSEGACPVCCRMIRVVCAPEDSFLHTRLSPAVTDTRRVRTLKSRTASARLSHANCSFVTVHKSTINLMPVWLRRNKHKRIGNEMKDRF